MSPGGICRETLEKGNIGHLYYFCCLHEDYTCIKTQDP